MFALSLSVDCYKWYKVHVFYELIVQAGSLSHCHDLLGHLNKANNAYNKICAFHTMASKENSAVIKALNKKKQNHGT